MHTPPETSGLRSHPSATPELFNVPEKMEGSGPVKVQVPRQASVVRFMLHPAGKTILAIIVLTLTLGLAVFTFYYVKYSRLIEAKLNNGPYTNTSMLFASPRTIGAGDVATPQEIAIDLRHAGYNEARNNRMGDHTLKAYA